MDNYKSPTNFRSVIGKNLFVIYYGWLIEDPDGTPSQEALTIAAARPDLLIASFFTFEPKYLNFSLQVMELLHGAGVRVFAYVDTSYGTRELDTVKLEAADYLGQGVDGIFFDQVYNFLDDSYLDYYQELYNLVHNQGKSVIVNTGIGNTGQDVMKVTDILMVEHAWREQYQHNSWFSEYPAERFMGNSSNEHEVYVDSKLAVEDTQEAWANGIGWHFSTDHYVTLPDWFLTYANKLGYGTPETDK